MILDHYEKIEAKRWAAIDKDSLMSYREMCETYRAEPEVLYALKLICPIIPWHKDGGSFGLPDQPWRKRTDVETIAEQERNRK